jgi:sigma-B regulation protein RsbU (phosphoserine phosphatase)
LSKDFSLEATKLIRKVRFPLKAKLILLISALITTSITFYVYFALDLFKKDKSAYIYETSLSTAETLSVQSNKFLNHTLGSINLLNQSIKENSSEDLLKRIFRSNENLISYTHYLNRQGKYSINKSLVNKKEFQFYNAKDNFLTTFGNKYPLQFALVTPEQIYIQGYPGAQIPHILIGLKDDITGDVYTARVLLTELLESFGKNKIYNSFLVNSMGQLVAGKVDETNVRNSDVIQKNYVLEILQNDLDNGVKEITKDGEKFLVAYQKDNNFKTVIVSEIPTSKAFSAAEYLTQKSLWFGLFVLSLAIMFGILYSRSLTKHLEKLFGATEKIAEGDFSTQVKVSGSDEVGALSDSFNYMSQEIVRYIDEMKEKARLENEMAVAQLVQNAFFPDDNLQFPHMKIAAYYTPASECGGDWWGHINMGDRSLIFIVDATGHGVPAALLTATANCCVNNLKTLAKSNPQVLGSPASILSFMNKAVHDVGGQILMTAFVGLFEHSTNTLRYSNASHNPPFHFKEGGKTCRERRFLATYGCQWSKTWPC